MSQDSLEMERAKEELLGLQAQARTAHLTGNAALMVEPFAEDFVSVGQGRILHPTRKESLKRFESYFGMVRFLAWEDIAPPVIWMATDASLATVLVHKRVHLEFVDENGTTMQEETIFAWQETWVREMGKWRLKMVVSTNAPQIVPKPSSAGK